MGEEDAVAVAINLQRDAGVMLSNLQILSQFVTSLQQMSTEMLDLGMGHVVSFGGGRDSVFGTAGCPVYSRDGIMASSVGSGASRACAGFILQCVHELSVQFPGGAGVLREVPDYILVLAEGHSSVASDRCSDFMNDCENCYELTLLRLVG